MYVHTKFFTPVGEIFWFVQSYGTTPTLSPRHPRRHTGTLEQRSALRQELHDFFIRPPS